MRHPLRRWLLGVLGVLGVASILFGWHLYAVSGTPNRLVVWRTGSVQTGPYNLPPKTITDALLVQTTYQAVRHMAPLSSLGCLHANQLSVLYWVDFYRGKTLVLTVRATPGACGVLTTTPSGRQQWRASTPMFWNAVGRLAGVHHPVRAALRQDT